MEIEPADAAEPRADQHVGRIAGKPRARDAVLHDVEGLDHHGRDAGPAARAEELPRAASARRRTAAQCPLGLASALTGVIVGFVGAVI